MSRSEANTPSMLKSVALIIACSLAMIVNVSLRWYLTCDDLNRHDILTEFKCHICRNSITSNWPRT